MSLLEGTKSLLRDHRSLPKKAFGQHFLVEDSIYQLMMEYASLNKNDTVLDIGAGLGFLTRLMAQRCRSVLAVEIDRKLAGILHEQVSGLPSVKVIEADILSASISDFNKIVSTPPYGISTRLLLWMLNQQIDCGVLIFQKDFAKRLAASVGSREYGWLTVLAYQHGEVELLEEVPRTMFYPRPNVDSIVARFTFRKSGPYRREDETTFRKFVQILFAQRNKKIRNAILPYLRALRNLSKPEAVKVAQRIPYRDKRVRELAPEDFGELLNAL